MSVKHLINLNYNACNKLDMCTEGLFGEDISV